MLLGSSREFWEVRALKEKGKICPLISIFHHLRAMCNKGAENNGRGIDLEEKKGHQRLEM